jgi:hypothetical protein
MSPQGETKSKNTESRTLKYQTMKWKRFSQAHIIILLLLFIFFPLTSLLLLLFIFILLYWVHMKLFVQGTAISLGEGRTHSAVGKYVSKDGNRTREGVAFCHWSTHFCHSKPSRTRYFGNGL